MSSLAVLNGTYANATSSAAVSGTLAVLASGTSVAAASSANLPTFTTTYTYCAKAADTTTVWDATYTIVEVVCAASETWTVPAVPPCFVESTVSCNSEIQTITCPVVVAERTTSVSICGNGVTASAGAWAEATATAVADEDWVSAGASAEAEATAGAGEGWFSVGASAEAEAKATADVGEGWFSAGGNVETEAKATASAGAEATAVAVADGSTCVIAAEATAKASAGASVAIVAGPATNSSSSINASASTTVGSWIVTADATSIKNSFTLVGTAVLLICPFLL
ncbi:hypothetical protein CMQ_720 [Grosmannia clavigera kw1407]|uniref:Uncharacterized protein n=1 Tax=Grosmannia clavigera (strain kw1407 / UAMH 11150) TaxID=655863 RepID=F0XEM9_GROCL|nr:uncharacterized protein CMQ_720 [Grosmannia clavigera kw1407]EFX03792.1 hypothetical protein CMQ_720 [Grosmannia clavigera kw1407]